MSMMIPSSVEAEKAWGAENRVIRSAASSIRRSSERHPRPASMDDLDRCGRGARNGSSPGGLPFDARRRWRLATKEPYRFRCERSAWPLGLRVLRGVNYWRGTALVNGAGTGLVEIPLDRPSLVRLGPLWARMRRLIVSADDPSGLVAALI
jgi:hypothetical protein